MIYLEAIKSAGAYKGDDTSNHLSEGAAILEYQNDGMTARKALHGGEEKTFTQSLENCISPGINFAAQFVPAE